MTRVANKKQRLRSGQWLSWSLRMGWLVVSTTIFEWLFNLWLKMWTNYRVVAVGNLLINDKPSIKATSVTCFGLVTYRVKGLQLKTGCPLSIKSWSQSLFSYKCTSVCSKNVSRGRHIVWKQSLPDDDIPSGISLPEVFSKNPIFLAQNSIFFNGFPIFKKPSSTASDFRETFFNGFPLSSILSKYSYLEYFDFPLRAS
jgi:hypothetical protein